MLHLLTDKKLKKLLEAARKEGEERGKLLGRTEQVERDCVIRQDAVKQAEEILRKR